MEKDFDRWNEIQKKLNKKLIKIFCKPRDIWWSSLGLNIGDEENGKNELFERPVLILKVFNKSIVRIAPLTSNLKINEHYFIIHNNGIKSAIIMSQLRTISLKRLSRKIGVLSEEQFKKLASELKDNLL